MYSEQQRHENLAKSLISLNFFSKINYDIQSVQTCTRRRNEVDMSIIITKRGYEVLNDEGELERRVLRSRLGGTTMSVIL